MVNQYSNASEYNTSKSRGATFGVAILAQSLRLQRVLPAPTVRHVQRVVALTRRPFVALTGQPIEPPLHLVGEVPTRARLAKARRRIRGAGLAPTTDVVVGQHRKWLVPPRRGRTRSLLGDPRRRWRLGRLPRQNGAPVVKLLPYSDNNNNNNNTFYGNSQHLL